jgi:ATP-dependent DNA ligase
MNRIAIVPGLSAPFYPMRPRRGLALNATTVNLVIAKMKTDVVQRKLNGDRAVLVTHGGRVLIFNRHNTTYSHTVLNGADFLQLGGTMVLDGEVWKSKFYPFECLVYKELPLVEYGPKAREQAAQQVCEKVKLPWLFGVTEDWLRDEVKKPHDLRSQWEGVVIKMSNAPYRVLGSESQESDTWAKWKWC